MAAAPQNPVQLPPVCAVTRPQNPQNPPNDNDFYAAIRYQERVRVALGQGQVNATDLRRARTYTDQIHTRITQGANAAPPWAIQMLNQINARFDDLDHLLYEFAEEADERFERLEASTARLEASTARLEDMVKESAVVGAKAFNMAAADGGTIPLEVVRFPNGDLPDDYENLPPLTDLADINALTGEQTSHYFQLYCPDTHVPHRRRRRRQKICRAIGCQEEPT